MIKLTHLNKYFYKGKENEVHVINDTSIELPSEGLITFLGASGSGKTTLLNVIGGLDKASGEFLYDDVELKNYKMHKIDLYRRSHIGYVFQNYNLILDKTVIENLKLNLELVGVTDEEEQDKRIEYALKAVHLYKYRKKKAFALSGGQQQRVSIARALVKRSKIFIADEPTGNLDMKNTIEIMNILRNISKESLVILVTHNRDLALSYSDKIYEVCDGKIVQELQGSTQGIIKYNLDNKIYLKDLEKKESALEQGKITIYQDESMPLSLNIIIKNGMVYIDSPQHIQLIQDTSIDLVDEHYTPVEVNRLNEDPAFDASWFSDKKDTKNFFRRCLKQFVEIKSNLKQSKRLVKFLYVALFFIGCILGFSVISFSNATSIDTTGMLFNKNYHMLLNEEYYTKEGKVLKDLYEYEYASDLQKAIQVTYRFSYNLSFHQSANHKFIFKFLGYDEQLVELAYGHAPIEKDEITIPEKEAWEIINQSDRLLNLERLIGMKVTINSSGSGGTFKICGVTRGDQGYVYADKDSFLRYQFSNNDLSRLTDLRYAPYEVDKTGQKAYSVSMGRDVNVDSSEKEILIRMDKFNDFLAYFSSISPINQFYIIHNVSYRIVGCFTYNQNFELNDNTFITNTPQPKFDTGRGACSLGGDEYQIVLGRDYENDLELIVPNTSIYEIGEKVDGRTVVGKYIGSTLACQYSGISTTNSVVLENYSILVVFKLQHGAEAVKYAREQGCKAITTYEHQIILQEIEDNNLDFIFEILFFILLGIAIIFVFLIMRSKMITDIYEIGVYRSLGGTRWQVSKKYLLESIVLTCITTFLGYILVLVIYSLLAGTINTFIDGKLYQINVLFGILGGITSFFVMIFFGILPILLLMRKTPSEICSKYDI
ncbi:MAG: ABC transporter ATP-binding protein/permease [Anaeroplasmataceae bacterium]|nr:ABC transporter ATP-binding protein/permease [Anaeroplasmataceae bacterium]